MTLDIPQARRIVLVLGDQLNLDSAVFKGFDPTQDLVLMAEVWEESTHVPSSKQRSVLFLSAMRHFAVEIREAGLPLLYLDLARTLKEDIRSLGSAIGWAAQRCGAAELCVVEPGDWRVLRALQAAGEQFGVAVNVLTDHHFLCTSAEFDAFAEGRGRLVMEHFYRMMRRRYGYLMETDGQPVGGQWNFDADNRKSFGAQGPGTLPVPVQFEPDALTLEVMELVERLQPAHPGSLDSFAWPVTRKQALAALQDFIDHRLPHFGRYEDAMWTGEPWLYHSRLSAALNLKLLDPREVLDAAQAAYRASKAPLAAVEGFIRQILGWREYVRGIYWRQMPQLLEANALGAHEPLPSFFWTGHTDMACLREAVSQTLEHGYAHHIQRLMVIGLYALLLGVEPQLVHEWYLAVYVDAVEWVEAPNTLGMSQFADGGQLATKPYIASGKYIDKMSNYCKGCRYRPSESSGSDACPFTTLYWDFLLRHEERLAQNPRMLLQLKNAQKLSAEQRKVIFLQAQTHRQTARSGDAPNWAPAQQNTLF